MLDKAIPLPAGSTLQHAHRTVLVVEDEVLVRMMVADELRSHGFTVIEAQNAHEAITLLQSRFPVDLIFTDVCLPDPIDGLGLVRLVRETRPELKVIVTSGDVAVSNGLEGIGVFLPKVYDPRQVAKRVKELLGDVER
jgi:CheY-like chemotaxis protein